MKHLIMLLRVALSATFVAFLIEPSVFGELFAGVALANLMPSGFSDPDRLKRWSQAYFRRVQSKVVFDERYTGVKMASDGPKDSDLVTAPPIVEINDLRNQKGTQVTHTLINPLFPDSESRLKSGRVKGQRREDSERSGSKNFVTIPLGTWFEGVKEEDVLIGKQEIGMGQLYKLMVELLSDNTSAYMDDDTVETFFQGHSRHLYHTIAKTKNAADQSTVTGNVDAGIKDPSEHPNTYAWVEENGVYTLKRADSPSVEDVHNLFADITSDAIPTRKLLDAIALEVRKQKIIGTQYSGGKSWKQRGMVKVVVDPITMQLIRDDLHDSDAVNSAYMATGDEHPIIAQGDVIWGPLHICEEEKMLDPAFSAKLNFGTESFDGVTGGVDESQIRKVTDSDGVERIYLEHGERTFDSETPAGGDSAIGPDGANKIGNIMVLGANSVAKVPGPVLPLIERTDDDYKRIMGLGAEHLFGCKRIDFVDSNRDFAFNQSSLRIAVYRGA